MLYLQENNNFEMVDQDSPTSRANRSGTTKPSIILLDIESSSTLEEK